jgi:hypothetical protein
MFFLSHFPKKSPDFDQNRLFSHTTSRVLSRLTARSNYLESASQGSDCTMDDCGVSPVNSATDVLLMQEGGSDTCSFRVRLCAFLLEPEQV